MKKLAVGTPVQVYSDTYPRFLSNEIYTVVAVWFEQPEAGDTYIPQGCYMYKLDGYFPYVSDRDIEEYKEVPASPRSMIDPKYPTNDELRELYRSEAYLIVPDKLEDGKLSTKENPLQVQVGGSHYKATKIQPIEVIWDWDLGFELGSALKYIQRHERKGGTEDIKKAIHYLELYIEREPTAS